MTVNWRRVFGTVTVIAIVGGAVYAIKKYKDSERDSEDVITYQDARMMVELEREALEISDEEAEEIESYREEQMYEESEEFEELVNDARDEASWNRSFMPYNDVEVEEDEETKNIKNNINKMYGPTQEEEEEKPDFEFSSIEKINFEVPLIETMTEEDKKLRHDPNSNEARNQYIRMELAEWLPREDVYLIMLELFNFPFEPKNDGDWDLKENLMHYRMNFFGQHSKWTREVTFADVVLHYVRSTVFNVGEDMRYWMKYFLEFNEFELGVTSHEYGLMIEKFNSHTYYNEETNTFGLFGLTREAMNSAIQIANNRPDNSITYDIEFNEFLKGCI